MHLISNHLKEINRLIRSHEYGLDLGHTHMITLEEKGFPPHLIIRF